MNNDLYHEMSELSDLKELAEAQKRQAELQKKAKAFDEIERQFRRNLKYVGEVAGSDMTGTRFHEMVLGATLINYFEERETNG